MAGENLLEKSCNNSCCPVNGCGLGFKGHACNRRDQFPRSGGDESLNHTEGRPYRYRHSEEHTRRPRVTGRDEAGRDEAKHLRTLVWSRFLFRGSRGRLVLARFPRRTLERSRRPKARVVIDVSVDADRSNLKATRTACVTRANVKRKGRACLPRLVDTRCSWGSRGLWRGSESLCPW